MNICGYYPESINEGSGIRAVIFISGCRHYCPGCFNAASWNFNYGNQFDSAEQQRIISEIQSNPLIDGITLCGGDPFFSASELVPFVEKFRSACPDLDVWAYSGFTYEEIVNDAGMKQLLEQCDVIIDGRFMEKYKDLTLQFRGSRNQRIINVKRSLESGDVIELMAVRREEHENRERKNA
jgi:anaerobic ribonucleoside-triphosphate reductase activating protein